MTDGKDYILQIKVKNGPLLRAMRQEGYETAAELSRACGVSYSTIHKLLGLKKPPLQASGEWSAPVLKIADHLRRLPEDLFPTQHLSEALKCSQAEVEVDLDEISLGIEAQETPERALEKSEAMGALAAVMASLPSREQRVLELRYGLTGDGPQTYEQIGHVDGVTKERIRQIEMRALRRMRHPSRSVDLQDCLEALS